jgi:hypothetical protein
VGTAYISITSVFYFCILKFILTVLCSVGAFFGLATHMYQERLYAKNVARKGVEARLYGACAAGILFPSGMFIYAWCAFPFVHWMGLIAGITIFMWANFTIYLAAFTYLADVYGPFASSSLAGQSLARNLVSFSFPDKAVSQGTNLTRKDGNGFPTLLNSNVRCTHIQVGEYPHGTSGNGYDAYSIRTYYRVFS